MIHQRVCKYSILRWAAIGVPCRFDNFVYIDMLYLGKNLPFRILLMDPKNRIPLKQKSVSILYSDEQLSVYCVDLTMLSTLTCYTLEKNLPFQILLMDPQNSIPLKQKSGSIIYSDEQRSVRYVTLTILSTLMCYTLVNLSFCVLYMDQKIV